LRFRWVNFRLAKLTTRKLKDFILNERSSLITDDRKRIKSELLDEIVINEVNQKLEVLCPGKELLSHLRIKLQADFGVRDLSLLVSPSQELKSAIFDDIIKDDE
jgi:hypothetical protein